MKKEHLFRLIFWLGISCAFIVAGSNVHALDYPTKNIMAFSPWPAGSASSNAFKGYLEYVEKYLGGKIIVDYKPGGMGAIGFIAVKNAKPDGYTLGMITISIYQIELDKLSDVSYRDFEILNTFTLQPQALFCHADSPWKTIEEFGAYAKKHPREIKCGYEGVGLLNIDLVSDAMGIKMIPIPFPGTSESLVTLLGKHIDVLSSSVPLAAPHIKAGTMRMLGVYGESRLKNYPEVPTFKEKGYNVVRGSWRIIVLPKGTAKPILDKLNVALKKAFDDPEFQKWADKVDIGPQYMSPEKTEQFLRTEFEQEKRVWESLKKK